MPDEIATPRPVLTVGEPHPWTEAVDSGLPGAAPALVRYCQDGPPVVEPDPEATPLGGTRV